MMQGFKTVKKMSRLQIPTSPNVPPPRNSRGKGSVDQSFSLRPCSSWALVDTLAAGDGHQHLETERGRPMGPRLAVFGDPFLESLG